MLMTASGKTSRSAEEFVDMSSRPPRAKASALHDSPPNRSNMDARYKL
jgi:hypothetical protein